MAILWALIVGMVVWIVLWAIGVRAFDAFMILVALVLLGTGYQLFKPILDRQLGRS